MAVGAGEHIGFRRTPGDSPHRAEIVPQVNPVDIMSV